MPPHTVFIIPYRNRQENKIQMDNYIENLKKARNWSDKDFKAIYSHQCDNRPFNRGAMKNIGFLMVKLLYPNDYHNINIVFHDVDSIPFDVNLFPYNTEKGVCSHYYGFKNLLGGIVVMKGQDFEKINGYPNFWGWGYEDNELHNRVINAGIEIDRSIFVDITERDKIPVLENERIKIINTREVSIYAHKGKMDGLVDIKNINFKLENEFGNVLSFTTGTSFERNEFKPKDLLTSGRTPGKSNLIRNWKLF